MTQQPQWSELLAIDSFGADFGADFGQSYPQYTQESPQVIIVGGCWIQRQSPQSAPKEGR
jgi:hypothetical protein